MYIQIPQPHDETTCLRKDVHARMILLPQLDVQLRVERAHCPPTQTAPLSGTKLLNTGRSAAAPGWELELWERARHCVLMEKN